MTGHILLLICKCKQTLRPDGLATGKREDLQKAVQLFYETSIA